MRAQNQLILSMIFFSISIYLLFTQTLYGAEIPEGMQFEGVINKPSYIEENLPLFVIDPYDYYFSYIELFIIIYFMAIGAGLFLTICKTALLEIYKYNEKEKNIGEKNKWYKNLNKKS